MSPRIMFYVQHLLGIGHLARTSLIAGACADAGMDVTVVTGGKPVEGLPPAGLRTVQLPPVAAGEGGFNDLVDEGGKPLDDSGRLARRDRLVASLLQLRPDAVVIEAWPFGRRQFEFELEPLVSSARKLDPRPVVICSVRDILQERSRAKQESTVTQLHDCFDNVLVHGDAAFARLEETFPLAPRIGQLLSYTGIVSAPVGPMTGQGADVVVSAGGGAASAGLMRTALAARSACSLRNAKWCVIAGRNARGHDLEALRGIADAGVEIVGHRSDFRGLLAQARLSISQAGYNTVADVLRTGIPSILVPFSAGGETEQLFRARRMETRGLAAVLPEADLTADRLATTIDQYLGTQTIKNPQRPCMDGARNSAATILRLTRSVR